MTSAPVKNAGSLPNYINAGNNVQSSRNGTDQNFGSAMNKATTGNRNLYEARQSVTAKNATAVKAADASKNAADVRKVSGVKSTEQPQKADSMEKQAEEITKAGEKMKNSIMETLDVSEEDLLEAMEILGLDTISLLDPSNLSQLVLTLGGETDPSSLLTNETLFQDLQSLNRMAGELANELQQTLSLSEEELNSVMAAVQEQMNGASQSNGEEARNLVNEPNGETEKEQKINVDIRVSGQEISVETDGNGTVTRTVSMTKADSEEAGDASGKESSGKQQSHESDSQTGLQSDQTMLNNPLQNKNSVADVSTTQSATGYTSNTREIMDQILDNIKIHITPNVDSLEMQLHPQSLGTVHVQLVNHAGEISAQFHVQNEAVKNAVETQMMELKEALNEQGVKVEAIEVSVDTRGFESNLWQGQENPGQEAYERQRRTPRRINLANLDASFEEEATEEDLLAAKMMEANGNTVDFTA